MEQPLRPLLGRKGEVEARPLAGTGPTAGHFEPTVGNEQPHVRPGFHQSGDPR